MVKAFILLALCVIGPSCEFDENVGPQGEPGNKIQITTFGTTDNTRYSATLNGALGDTYGREVQDYGHCWGTQPALICPVISLRLAARPIV